MADTKQQWYKDAKYGLFIHWGLYSILAGEWKDPKTGEVTKTDRIAEWIENNLNIDKEDYRKLKDEFHPDKFDADMFVKRAKEQWGVKYIVLTSKHHEGFAMYDSKVSDFNVVKAAGRDILRELSDACKKYDMTMGIYYSQAQDWDDDNAYKKDYEDKNEWKPEFRIYFDEKCKPQLKELLENYDNISLIWFDTPMGMTADEAQELRDWVKGIKPDCIISGRIGHSLVVATLTTVFNTVVGMMAAYILSRKDYKFLKWVYVFFMIGVMVPVHCTLIPINNIATALNAKNNLFFLILIYVAFGMSQAIFLYTGFMDGISRNLDEAAIIDGCNNWQLLWKILFPVCKPIIATEAIFVFIYGYSELVFSMILMTDTKYFTVSRAMLNFSSAHTQEIGSQFAYVVMSVIPMIIIYIVFHKQIEKGMLSGAIKG